MKRYHGYLCRDTSDFIAKLCFSRNHGRVARDYGQTFSESDTCPVSFSYLPFVPVLAWFAFVDCAADVGAFTSAVPLAM